MSTEDVTFKVLPTGLVVVWVGVGKWGMKAVAPILRVVLRGIIVRARDGNWVANEARR